jgi:hypothetical protein
LTIQIQKIFLKFKKNLIKIGGIASQMTILIQKNLPSENMFSDGQTRQKKLPSEKPFQISTSDSKKSRVRGVFTRISDGFHLTCQM